MATHETGHVLHAWLSGGHVERVAFPWLGFSRTDVSLNPHPLFVAWGGALWGTLIPLALLALATASGFRLRRWVQFFTGFCLIANGAYSAAGSVISAGDAGDLMRYGAPQWQLIAVGTCAATVGLYLWHRLGVQHSVATGDQGQKG